MIREKNEIFGIDQIALFSFALLAFWIPLYKKFLPPIIALCTVLSMIKLLKSGKYVFKQKVNKGLIFLIGFYLLHILGLLYTSDLDSGLFDLEVKLSFLIMPFCFYSFQEKIKKNLRLILTAFVLGVFLAALFCLTKVTYDSFQNELGVFNAALWEYQAKMSFIQLLIDGQSRFNYTSLSFFHHPAYFSMYSSFSIAVIYYFLIASYKQKSIIIRSLFVLGIFFLLFIVFLLQARAGWLALFAFVIVEIIRVFYRGKYKILKIGFFLFITLSAFLVTAMYSGRFKSAFNKGGNDRVYLWENGLEVFSDNILFGVGTGDLKKELERKYIAKNEFKYASRSYNVHNQYIELLATLGIVALIFFLFMFGRILYIASGDSLMKKGICIAFFILLAVNFLFESMLNTIAGVSFFAFFYSLLNLKDDEQSKKMLSSSNEK